MRVHTVPIKLSIKGLIKTTIILLVYCYFSDFKYSFLKNLEVLLRVSHPAFTLSAHRHTGMFQLGGGGGGGWQFTPKKLHSAHILDCWNRDIKLYSLKIIKKNRRLQSSHLIKLFEFQNWKFFPIFCYFLISLFITVSSLPKFNAFSPKISETEGLPPPAPPPHPHGSYAYTSEEWWRSPYPSHTPYKPGHVLSARQNTVFYFPSGLWTHFDLTAKENHFTRIEVTKITQLKVFTLKIQKHSENYTLFCY